MDSMIKEILIELLKHKTIVSSWGIENITISDNCIHFHANGFRYCGLIDIQCKNEKIYIQLEDLHLLEHADLNSIVQMLDAFIEKDGRYAENLCNWIKKAIQGI